MTASAVISRPMGLRSFPSATRPRSTPDSAAWGARRPPETGPVANSKTRGKLAPGPAKVCSKPQPEVQRAVAEGT